MFSLFVLPINKERYTIAFEFHCFNLPSLISTPHIGFLGTNKALIAQVFIGFHFVRRIECNTYCFKWKLKHKIHENENNTVIMFINKTAILSDYSSDSKVVQTSSSYKRRYVKSTNP